MPVHLTAEQRQLALRLKARGLSLRAVGPQVGCSHQGWRCSRGAARGGRFGRIAGCQERGG
jgi:hypothetical protein